MAFGPATAAKMNRVGIHTGLDLRAWTLPDLQAHFGKSGAFFHAIARGVDHRPVRADRIRKSIGAENTFAQDLSGFEEMRECLQPILDRVWSHCADAGLSGRTVTLKVKYADFEQITRSRSIAAGVTGREELERLSVDLLTPLFPVKKGRSAARRFAVVAQCRSGGGKPAVCASGFENRRGPKSGRCAELGNRQ